MINTRSRPIAVSIFVIALAVAMADLGTAVVLVATTVAVIFVAGVDYRYLATCALLGAAAWSWVHRDEAVSARPRHRLHRQGS